jgi:hypothetical protein
MVFGTPSKNVTTSPNNESDDSCEIERCHLNELDAFGLRDSDGLRDCESCVGFL